MKTWQLWQWTTQKLFALSDWITWQINLKAHYVGLWESFLAEMEQNIQKYAFISLELPVAKNHCVFVS